MDFTVSLHILDDGTSRSRSDFHSPFFLTAGTEPAQSKKRHASECQRGQAVH